MSLYGHMSQRELEQLLAAHDRSSFRVGLFAGLVCMALLGVVIVVPGWWKVLVGVLMLFTWINVAYVAVRM